VRKFFSPNILINSIKFFVGIIAAIILNLFLFEFLQGLIAVLFGFEKVSFLFADLELYNIISFTSEKPVIVLFIVFFSPQILSIIFSELGILLLVRKQNSFLRIFIISNLFLLLLLVGVFTIIILLGSNLENDWSLFFYFTGASQIIKNIVLSIVTLTITVYSIVRIYKLIKYRKRYEQING